jgi:EAL domain-containing protein (putative c-di-GMP-specific phosphodiesterase class I)
MEVYYQPQIDLETNRVTGLEALLRWTSHELGPVSPYRFIEVAESNRFIIPLGDWVLSQACGFIRELHDSGYDGMKISVNISIIQIMQADFVDKVKKTLELYQLEPDCLELEVTETVLIKSLDVVFHKLKQLDEMGIGIALDDFGKGYSSLNYLRQLPIKVLKIDKSFIDHITMVCEQKEITKHIIHMGKALGMTIIAEGVETQDQMMHLRKYQCDTIQGYYYSKPLPRLALKEFIQGYNENNQAVSE